jgi:hypothetical protein
VRLRDEGKRREAEAAAVGKGAMVIKGECSKQRFR